MKKYNLGIDTTIDIIGGKWKVLILCRLINENKRTGELQKSIPGITQKMLIQQLRGLENDGIVFRHIYNEMPPKVEYGITEYGKSLMEIIELMCDWGKNNIKKRKEQGEDVVLLEDD